MRAFEMDEVSRNAMKTLHDNGTEVVRAYQENGVYVLNRNEELSNPNKNKDKNKFYTVVADKLHCGTYECILTDRL